MIKRIVRIGLAICIGILIGFIAICKKLTAGSISIKMDEENEAENEVENDSENEVEEKEE